MKKLLLCVALMGVTGLCYAQTAYTAPTIVPQAPETASLLKYTETPVSYSTGVPNISIPIASISGRGLSASVSISYHAGGLRVTEESSWLGLGWNLSAGGQITRSKRGRADDHYPNGFLYTNATVNALETACAENETINGFNCTQLTNNEGGYDYEPDDFNYSMLGLSGRFMFDQNRDSNNPKGHVIQFPEKNVIITPIYDTIVSPDHRKRIIAWDIKDTNGNVYHFEEGNIFLKSINTIFKAGGFAPEFVQDPGNSSEKYTETWNLVSVTSESGDVITFEYNRPQVEVGSTGNYWAFNDYNCTPTDEQVAVVVEGSSTGYDPTQSVVTYTGVERSYTELTKITSSQGYIELIRSNTQREDTQFEKYALKGVKVYSTATTSPTLIKDVDFIQDYLVSTPSSKTEFIGSYGAGSPDLPPNQNSFLNKRLRLNEVKFHSVATTLDDSYSYTFDYNTTKLPHKRSKGQDHWGYYNGEDSNFTLIPDFVVNIPGYANAVQFTFSPAQGSADREVNQTYSNASILQSITYPEGGKTTYTFENNSGLDNGNLEYFGGLRIKQMRTTADDVEATKDKIYEYEGGHVLSKPIYYSVGTGNVHAMHSQSWQPLLTTQGSYVNYTKVTETESSWIKLPSTITIIPGNTKDGVTTPNDTIVTVNLDITNRTTARTFSPVTGNLSAWNTPYVQEWSAGQLKFLQYGEDSKVKQIKSFVRGVYSNPTVNNIRGFSPVTTWAINDPNLPFLLNNFSPDACVGACTISPYNIYPGRKLPYSEITETYEGGQTMLTEKYTYFDSKPEHFNPTRIITKHSDGKVIETRMKYPYEMNHNALLLENKVNTVLFQEYIKDSILLQSVKNEYQNFNGIQKMKAVKAGKYQLFAQPVTYTGGLVSIVQPPVTTSGLEERLVYHDYYDNGNIQEVSKKDGTHVVYVWGYNQSVPIAKIENATYAQVSSYVTNLQNLSNLDDDRTLGSLDDEGALRTALNALRTNLPNAMVTTFTYDPMIGVTSITDPRGDVIYYQYDGFNRLETVKDKDGNILKENQYHYKN